MRVLLSKQLQRFVRRENITEDELLSAIDHAEKGLIDADLGGGVIKQRIAREGEGRRSGGRTIIYYRRGNRAIFQAGFVKASQDNITVKELRIHKKAAKTMLALSNEQIDLAVASGVYKEII